MMRRTFFSFLKEPPVFFAAIVWAAMFAAVGGAVACMVLELTGVLPYCLYALAAVTLGYSVYLAVRLAPKMKADILAQAHRHAFTDSLVSDYGFRTAAFAVVSFVINVGYALFNGAMALAAQSVWFAVFALYYLLLSGMRLGVLAADRGAKKKYADEEALYGAKLKIYRGCGIALLPLELALAGAVTLMVLRQDPTPHSEIAAITSAAYAFYKITLARQPTQGAAAGRPVYAGGAEHRPDGRGGLPVRSADDARERVFGRRRGEAAALERCRRVLRVRADARPGNLDDCALPSITEAEGLP